MRYNSLMILITEVEIMQQHEREYKIQNTKIKLLIRRNQTLMRE